MAILENINFDWSYDFAWAMIHSLWQGLILLILVLVFQQFKYFKSPERKYHLYTASYLALFICFIANLIFPIGNQDVFNQITSEVIGIEWLSLTAYIENSSGHFLFVHEMTAIFWILGFGFFLSRQLVGNFFLAYVRFKALALGDEWEQKMESWKQKMNIRRNISLVTSCHIQVPVTIGFLKPIIAFPISYFTQLTPDQFEAILIHELSHVKRNDFIMNQLQALMNCILFFNPVSWYLSHHMKTLREFVCDDQVQLHLNKKKVYIQALYKIATRARAPYQSIAIFKNKPQLIMRVKRIINPDRNTNSPSFYGISIVLIILSSLFVWQTGQQNVSGEMLQMEIDQVFKTEMEIPLYDIAEIPGLLIPKKKRIEGNSKTEAQSNVKYEVKIDPIVMSDTVPDQEKIKELEFKIQEKNRELEELSEKLEREFLLNIEADAKRIEELAAQLEDRITRNMKTYDEDSDHSQNIKRIEELSLKLEMKIKEKIGDVETELDEQEMHEAEQSLEEISIEIEKLVDDEGKVKDEKKMEELRSKMEVQVNKIQNLAKEFSQKHKNLEKDPEVIKLKEEIQIIAQEMSQQNMDDNDIWDEESKRIQAEMKELEKSMQENLLPIQKKIQSVIEDKAKELVRLYRELESVKKGKNKE